MRFANVTLMDTDGRYQWSGSLRAFFRDNAMPLAEARTIVQSLRPVDGRFEPAFIGGGSGPEWALLLEDA